MSNFSFYLVYDWIAVRLFLFSLNRHKCHSISTSSHPLVFFPLSLSFYFVAETRNCGFISICDIYRITNIPSNKQSNTAGDVDKKTDITIQNKINGIDLFYNGVVLKLVLANKNRLFTWIFSIFILKTGYNKKIFLLIYLFITHIWSIPCYLS
jgi:hypothetical protein